MSVQYRVSYDHNMDSVCINRALRYYEYRAAQTIARLEEKITFWGVITLICDFILVVCGAVLLATGFLILTQKIQLTRVLYLLPLRFFYDGNFRIMGQLFMAVGVLYMILGLCGLKGILNHNKFFLCLHNICLLFILMVHCYLILNIYGYIFQNSKSENSLYFRLDFQKLFYNCRVIPGISSSECCCVSRKSSGIRTCWQYDEDYFPAGLSFSKICSESNEALGLDLYQRLNKVLYTGFLFYVVKMCIQVITLISGIVLGLYEKAIQRHVSITS